MEHPPKQGLKRYVVLKDAYGGVNVLMEHPPKQGLKHRSIDVLAIFKIGFNGTSTKTRIETIIKSFIRNSKIRVLMEHPPKQGLKPE